VNWAKAAGENQYLSNLLSSTFGFFSLEKFVKFKRNVCTNFTHNRNKRNSLVRKDRQLHVWK